MNAPRRRYRPPLAAVMALFLAAAPLAAQRGDAADGGAVIGRAARVYQSLRSLRADFVQRIDNPMIDSAVSRGTLTQAGPVKFAMRFSDPPGEAIVIDGTHIWLYTPSTTPGQVLRLGIPSGGPAYGYNILAWLLDRPKERYRATLRKAEKIGGRMADVVELVPIAPDLPFTRAVLWLDQGDALPRRLEIHEAQGNTRTLTLSKLRPNVPVSGATFAFEVPPKTRVIDQ